MSDTLPPCPACSSAFTYEMDALLVCPECGHEWAAGDAQTDNADVRDSVGNLLADGDTVTVIKDLKVKGTSTTVKVGTKVRGGWWTGITTSTVKSPVSERWALSPSL